MPADRNDRPANREDPAPTAGSNSAPATEQQPNAVQRRSGSGGGLDTTADHLLGVLDAVKQQQQMCTHFEMETYTWEVMPAGLKNRSVVDQLVAEYEWTLARLTERGLATV